MKRILMFLVVLLAFFVSQLYGFGVKGKMGIGFNVNTQKLYGDNRSGDFVFGGTPLILRYDFKPSAFIESDFTYSKLSTRLPGRTGDNAQMLNLGFKLGYRFRSQRRFNPIVYVGAGAFNFKLDNNTRFWDGYASLGGGAEYFFSPNVGLNFTGDFRYTTGDDFDGSRTGLGKDGFFTFAMGFNFYLHKKSGHSGRSGFSPYGDDLYDVSSEESSFDDFMRSNNGTTTDAATMQEITELTEEKTALETRVEQKETEIQMLNFKLNSFNQYEELLMDRAKITGMEVSTEDVDSNPVVHNYKNALVLFEAEQFEDAVDLFKKLLRTHPNHEQASNWWYWLGESYYNIGDYDSAEKSFDWSSLKNRNHSRDETTHMMLGLSQWRGGQLQKALDEFKFLLRNTNNRRSSDLLNGFIEKIQSELPKKK